MTNDASNTPPKAPSQGVPPSANQGVAPSTTPGSGPKPATPNPVDDKLSKFGDLERAPRRFDQPTPPGQAGVDPKVQTIHDAVKDIVRAAQAEGSTFEVDSRTDVQRHLKVAVHKDEELLLVNTDVYVPGQWFIRKQWRRIGDEPGDDFFLRSARNRRK